MSVEMIQNKYNPENDMIPGGPDVNWVDIELLYLIEGLHKRCQELEKEIAQLKNSDKPDWMIGNLPRTNPQRDTRPGAEYGL